MITALAFLVMVVLVVGGCCSSGYDAGGDDGVHGGGILKHGVGIGLLLKMVNIVSKCQVPSYYD